MSTHSRILASFVACLCVAAPALGQSRPWTDGRVPVRFDPSITPVQQDRLFRACAQWTAVAAVTCAPAGPHESAWLEVVTHTDACRVIEVDPHYGQPGPRVGVSWLNVGPGCWYPHILTHEIGHVFGLIHEHQRADRDRYVDVLYDNLLPGQVFAYMRLDHFTRYTTLAPYDQASIMHYGAWDWSNGRGPTLRSRDGQPMGGTVPSAGDAQKMRAIYGTRSRTAPLAELRLTATVRGAVVDLTWTGLPTVDRYQIIARDVTGALLAAIPVTGPALRVQAPRGVYVVTVAPASGAPVSAPIRIEIF